MEMMRQWDTRCITSSEKGSGCVWFLCAICKRKTMATKMVPIFDTVSITKTLLNVKKLCFSMQGIFNSFSQLVLYLNMKLLQCFSPYIQQNCPGRKKAEKNKVMYRDNIILIFIKQQNCFHIEYYNPGLLLFSVVLSHFSTQQSMELFSTVPD